MTLLAANPTYRPVVPVTGGPVEYRSPVALASAEWQVRREGATLGSGTATVTSGPGWLLYVCAVPPLAVAEGYEVVLAGGEGRRAFDVARLSYGPLLGAEDILSERPAAGRMLDQLASVSEVTRDEIVFALAGRARAMLDDLVRDRLFRVEGAQAASSWATRAGVGQVYLRGWMVADMDRLRRVERYLLVYELYSSAADGSGVEDEDATLAASYLARARAALESAGPLRVDIDSDGQTDGVVRPNRSRRLRRVSG